MKILFIHRDLPPDSYTGVSVQVHRLAGALFTLGHDVTVLTFSNPNRHSEYKIVTVGRSLNRFPFSLFFKPFKRILAPWVFRSYPKSNFDIVHIHGDGAFIRSGPNVIRTFYGTAAMERRFSISWKSKLAQSLSFIFEKMENRRYTSQGTAVSISNHAGTFLPCISEVIPCMLHSAPNTAAFCKDGPPRLIFMGSCGTRKRGELALWLYAKLSEQFPSLKLYYVGSSSNQDKLYFKEKYGENIQTPEFHQNISPSQLSTLFNKSHIFLSLSSYEGFGVPIIEAMSCRCMVISFITPGSSEIIDDKVTGIFTNSSSLYQDTLKALTDEEWRNEIAEKGFQKSFEYSPEKIALRYQEIYLKKMRC